MKKLVLLSIGVLSAICAYGQPTNVNQNTVIIHNAPTSERVIVKTEYVDRYRTVYVDRPQPKRVARKLSAPLLLQGYLWVYTEDIGNFKSQRDALEIIGNINRQAPFGRNDWRIPTSAELSVMEQNAAAVGLGDDIYIATDHANGVLRMVSTGPTVAEQRATAARAEAERQREANETQMRAEEQRRRAEAQRAVSESERRKYSMIVGNIVWDGYNLGATSISNAGAPFSGMAAHNKGRKLNPYIGSEYTYPLEYRIPTKQEGEALVAALIAGGRSERVIINDNVVYKYYDRSGQCFAVPFYMFDRTNRSGYFTDVRILLKGAVERNNWAYYAVVFPYSETGCPKPYVTWFEDVSAHFGGFYGDDPNWGFVRLVTAKPTVAEQRAEAERFVTAKPMVAEQRAEAERLAAERRAEEARLATERQRQVETAKKIAEEQRTGVLINGVRWSMYNLDRHGVFVNSPEQFGVNYDISKVHYACPAGWRAPTSEDFNKLFRIRNEWTKVNGVSGRKFSDGNNTIFFPGLNDRPVLYATTDTHTEYGIYYYYCLKLSITEYNLVNSTHNNGMELHLVRCVRK